MTDTSSLGATDVAAVGSDVNASDLGGETDDDFERGTNGLAGTFSFEAVTVDLAMSDDGLAIDDDDVDDADDDDVCTMEVDATMAARVGLESIESHERERWER